MEQAEGSAARLSRPPTAIMLILALLLSNAALALGPSFVRMADTGPVASAFWRMALAVPMLFLITRRMGQPVNISGRGVMVPLALAALFFAGDLASWHSGILQTRLANATLFGNAASFFYPVYGFILAKSLPSRVQALALALGVAGAMLLLGRSYELSARNLVGDLLCLTAGTLYTLYLIAVARARDTLPSWTLLSWMSLFTAVPLLVLARLLGEAVLPTDWTPLIALAVVSQLVGQGLLVWIIDKVSPLLLGLALMTQPIMAAAIGWSVFGEALTAPDIIGGVLVMMALVLVRR